MNITKEKIFRALTNSDYRKLVIQGRICNIRRWYEDKTGYYPPPKYVTLFITHICNLHCRMCAQYGDSGTTNTLVDRPVMSVEVAQKIINQIESFHPSITLMGGEPLSNPNWPEITKIVKEKNLFCDVITNGTLLERNAQALVDSGIDCINISLDGIGQYNDVIRGKGVYDKVVRGVEAVNSIRKASGKVKPEINFFFTINGPNHTHLIEFVEWASTQPIKKVVFNHLRFYSQSTYEKQDRIMKQLFGGNTDCQAGFIFEPDPIDTDILGKQISEIKQRKWPIEIYCQPNHPIEELDEYYHNEHYTRKTIKDCAVPFEGLSIESYGNVVPCMDFVCGNINDKNILDIWNGEEYRKFRRFFNKHGRFPICHRCCV